MDNNELPIIERVKKYLENTEYLYDSGVSDYDRAQELPEHRQNIRDLLHVLDRVLYEKTKE